MSELELIKKVKLLAIHNDCNRAEEIWKDMFIENFGDDIIYLFRKGSTYKDIRQKLTMFLF